VLSGYISAAASNTNLYQSASGDFMSTLQHVTADVTTSQKSHMHRSPVMSVCVAMVDIVLIWADTKHGYRCTSTFKATHVIRHMTQCLNERISDRRTGRGDGQNWPQRSPDFTPADFNEWSYPKNVAQACKINTIFDAERSINNSDVRKFQISRI
jgi:hypothetical protein